MSDMSDKELLEQLNIIKADAESIEVSENISFDKMMVRYWKKETAEAEERAFDTFKGFEIREETKPQKSRKKRRIFKICLAAGLAVAMLAIVISSIVKGNRRLQDSNDYYKMVKADTESDTEVATLSGYQKLHQYFIVDNTMEVSYSVSERVGGFFRSMFSFGSADGAAEVGSSYDDYSDTNTRTENIDEADVAKTDGGYLYYFERNEEEEDASLIIAKAGGSDTRIVSETALAKYLYELKDNGKDYNLDGQMEIMLYEDKLVTVIAYQDYTVLVFFDITDKNAPKHISTLYVEGNYQSCRLIGDYLYVFSDKYLGADEREYIEDDKGALSEEEAEKLLAIRSSNGMVKSEDVYVSECTAYCNFLVISTVDMKDTGEFKQIKAVLGSDTFGKIYMSAEHIYYLSNMNISLEEMFEVADKNCNETITVSKKTEIISLSIDEGMVEPVARTVIDGLIGDEYDVDEYNGYLRLAVSTSKTVYEYLSRERTYYDGFEWCREYFWNEENYIGTEDSGSALYILDADLQLVGSISNLKEDESVYGVRFDGDIGYVVTYRQTDPLFTIDLSDPANPEILGELELPGFSEYLHIWDENTLIGLGYNSRGTLKLSTYDITDKANVTEKYVCNIQAYNTEALYNHRAILISPEKGIVGFACGYEEYYNVYKYEEGIFKEVISHNMYDYSEADGATGNIRGLYAGDYLYIITERKGVIVYDLNTYERVDVDLKG